ncbi:hypothetical protein M199_gp235 [Halogranum tailed virus 1]|uniref:Uncharacterized protein n=1 Tax=Halogranum tailed virus 1 TaxID=1273749 RepID=R4TGR3_9CAUD|nr:hypothetical protein M199_gp235 [Halogranum tailed virus 1]AGM11431.1 hypothetical protein HGTV1_133 [Halogranum tailed virus 1]
MGIDELSHEEQLELAKMHREMGPADMTSLALLAKYSPEEFDEMIDNLKEVQNFFEDMEYLMLECQGEQQAATMRSRINQIEQLLELLRTQRDNHQDSVFY